MTRERMYVSPADLREFATQIFERLGLPDGDAGTVAACLVSANLRGLDSHGVSRIPIYAKRLRLGLVNPRPNLQVSRTAPGAVLVDGDNGMGMVVGTRAMAEALAIAREVGLGLAGVRRSTHYGMAASYVLQAIAAGQIGFAFTNSSPGMAPYGGSKPVLGVNPLAVGVPAGQRSPFVLDMAMSIIARGKMRLAAMQGESIPGGLGLDREGQPTTDGMRVFGGGTVLPFGEAKGSGLAVWMEIMAGVLTGAAFAGEMRSLYEDFSGPQAIGHLFLAIRPDLFMSREEFVRRMDTMLERFKDAEPVPGVDEVLMPGEPEERQASRRACTGIPMAPEIVALLRREAEELGVPFPAASPTPLAL